MTITKNELKEIASLQNKKYRKLQKRFIIEGKRLVEQGLSSRYLCEQILVTPDFEQSNHDFIRLIKISGKSVEVVKSSEFNKISDTKTPQGIAAVMQIPEKQNINFNEELIVALENVSDPGNMGAILRNCDWFGVKTIIVSETSADVYNSKVLRSSMGAALTLNIVASENFLETLEDLKSKKFSILTADMDGEPLYSYEPQRKNVIVFSNEANGPTDELLNLCTEKITIPKKGRVESLNVACASSVILSELTKNSHID